MGTTKITAIPGTPFIDIEREVAAPRELVHRAYSDPELLRQWLGPRKYEMIVDAWEPADGRRWRYVHRDADGTEYAFHGVFHGPQTVDRMVQTFEFEGAPGYVSLDAVEFIDQGGRTLIRTHSVHQTVEARDAMIEAGMSSGVEEGFERLDELVGRLGQPVAASASS